MKAREMKPGKTYRYEPDGNEPGGTVKVASIEHEHGDIYVTGVWTHEPAWEHDGEGGGAFDPDDPVTEVPT